MGMVSVVTPAVRRSLTTTGRYRVLESPPEDLLDSQLETIIGQATSLIEGHCDRVFGRERVTETFFVKADRYLFLTRVPATEVHEIRLNGEPLDTAFWRLEDRDAGIVALESLGTTDSAAFYRAVSNGNYGWPEGEARSVKMEVEYTGGYLMPDAADATLPADLEMACQTVVRKLLERRASSVLGLSSERLGDASWTYRDDSKQGPVTEVVPTLDRYRLVRVTG